MTERKRQRILFWLPAAVFLMGLALLSALWKGLYQRAAYDQISAFCGTVLDKHPELEDELLSSVKEFQASADFRLSGWNPAEPSFSSGPSFGPGLSGENFLARYGYESRAFGSGTAEGMSLLTAAVGVLALAVSVLCGRISAGRKHGRIAELTRYLEQVNTGAPGVLVQEREDEYSALQDEIYKTVTNLYVTREEAVGARKSFADNLANIAHQLKTPLTAADLSLQLMEKNVPDSCSIYTGSVRRQIERLGRLEEALLTLSKIDAGTLELRKDAVDVYTVLSLAAENLQEISNRAGVQIEIPDRGCAEFQGDMEWTMEALMNLLKNCVEHAPEGGRVFCDYSENPLYAQILIWDQGAGFAPEELPHLFERFYRGKNAVPGSAGIGLAIARSIFEMQNGSLTARNRLEGGACFEIRIYSH